MTEITRLETIPFHGAAINAVRTDEGVRIAIRPVCEAIGLDYSAQWRRLERQPWAVVAMTATTGSDGKTYEMATVDRRTFVMWLATVDTGRLKNDSAKDMLGKFQNEAADVLDAHFSPPPRELTDKEKLVALARGVLEAEEARQLAEIKAAQLELEVEHAGPAVRYFDKFVCDTDAVRIDDWGKQHGLAGHAPYDLLAGKGAIYKRHIGDRWSGKAGKKVSEYEYRPRAGWQAYFDLRPQHNAPRHHNGQVRQTLYVRAATSVELALKVGLNSAEALPEIGAA